MSKRNPSGYGCVTRLKGKRSRPWIVKVTVYDQDGHGKQVPIGYEETEEKGNILLAKYNNNPWNIDREKVTLAILYNRWLEVKAPKLGKSNLDSLKSASSRAVNTCSHIRAGSCHLQNTMNFGAL